MKRDDIVAAALRVLDREGLANLSMRAVATDLGTAPASLYSHVRSKEELLDLLFDEVVGDAFTHLDEIDELAPGDWTEQLVEMGLRWRRSLLRHPDLCLVVLGRTPTGPNYLWVMERYIDVLRRVGLPFDVISLLVDAMELYVNSFVAIEAQKGSIRGGMHRGLAQRLVGQHEQDVPRERFPNIRDLADAPTVRSEDRFVFGLRALLHGISTLTTSSAATPAAASAPVPALDSPEHRTLRLQLRQLDLQLRAMTTLLETMGPI